MAEKKGVKLLILAPVVRHQKGQFKELFKTLAKKGYSQIRVDGKILKLDDKVELIRTNFHNIEAVVDRIVIEPESVFEKNEEMGKQTKNRLFEAIEQALEISAGLVVMSVVGDN